MKARVHHGPGLKVIEDRPKPEIKMSDAIVRMVKTTICGIDLYILKGDAATCAPGRILGHEGSESSIPWVSASPLSAPAIGC